MKVKPGYRYVFALAKVLMLWNLKYFALKARFFQYSEVMHGLSRPVLLAIASLSMPAFLIYFNLFDSRLLEIFSKVKNGVRSEIEIKDFIQIAFLFFGIPTAFIIWIFRDYNANASLENQRKDVNLKEFQELQLRAAGALDSDIGADSRQVVEIAALHQLKIFLRGDYGPSFRRPAFEIFRARMQKNFPEIAQNIKEKEQFTASIHEIDPVSKAIRNIVISERLSIINDYRDLSDTCLDTIVYPAKTLFYKASFARSSVSFFAMPEGYAPFANFFRSKGRCANFSEAVLDFSNFEKSKLEEANFFGASISYANFLGLIAPNSYFRKAKIIGSDFWNAQVSGSNFKQSEIDNSNFRKCNINSCSFTDALIINSDFERIRATRSKFHRSNIKKVSAKNSNFEFAIFSYSKVVADFSGCSFYRAQFINCDVSNSDFSKCVLRGANIACISPEKLKSCVGAVIDMDTRLLPNWEVTDEKSRADIRKRWVAHGAIFE